MKTAEPHRKAYFTDERQLQQMLRHLGAVTERMDQAVVITDLAGKVHFANTRWAQIHGYDSSSALLDKHLRQFYDRSSMRETVVGFMTQVKNTGLCSGHAEHVKCDGTKFRTKLKMSAIKNSKGKTEGFLILADDMKPRHLLEDELRQTRKQVEILQAAFKKAKQAVAAQSTPAQEKLRKSQEQVEVLQAAWKKAKQATVAQSAAAEEKMKRAQEQVDVLQAELEKVTQAVPAGSVQPDEKKPEGTLSTSELSELARMAKRFRKPNMPN